MLDRKVFPAFNRPMPSSPPAPPRDPKAEKAQRLAAALRSNLKRRKTPEATTAPQKSED